MELTSQIAIYECPDANAQTIAIDADGRFTIVSGRKCMYLIDLNANDPAAPTTNDDSTTIGSNSQTDASVVAACNRHTNQNSIKKLIRNTKWDPISSHFNKHLKDLFALTAYQAAEVFSISNLDPTKPKFVLRGHSRAITDVKWSNSDPYLIGTSSADCLTNLWDIRDHRRPSASLSSVSSERN